MDNKSQSPSLRGSGRFPRPHAPVLLKPGVSQSPSLRGSGRFRRRRVIMEEEYPGLNPLHCGAVVASRR